MCPPIMMEIELADLTGDDQIDEDELEGFLPSSSAPSSSKDRDDYHHRFRHSRQRPNYWFTGLTWYKTEFIRLAYCIGSLLLLATCVAILPNYFSSAKSKSPSSSGTTPSSSNDLSTKNSLISDPGLENERNLPVVYSCPKEVRQADNSDAEFEEDYIEASNKIASNLTQFMSEFRSSNYDAWGKSYQYVKNQSTPFKAKYYPPNLKNGDTLFESACGVGLNLFMTLEILQDAGIEDLIVYGNEYLDISTQEANAVFDHIAPAGSTKGILCTADSAHLEFIPSGSFDLVYTGYITPVADPIKFGGKIDHYIKEYSKLCKSDKEDWEAQKLIEVGQQRQNDWYGNWVAEMSRIAKPGRPVIAEQVSYPYCEAQFDWGGVSQEFWYESARSNKYGWNIDPGSIEMMNDTIFTRRYHVFMRKREDG